LAIRSFKSTKLQLYFEAGYFSFPTEQQADIQDILTALHAVETRDDLQKLVSILPGNEFEPNWWSFTVTTNGLEAAASVICRFEPPDVFDVDYVSHH